MLNSAETGSKVVDGSFELPSAAFEQIQSTESATF
jgi:hypothetical protein